MSSPRSASPAQLHVQKARYFFSGTSILLFVLMVLGFQLFYLKGQSFPGREIPPPIKTQIILHGTFMTAWMTLLVIQPLLIAQRNRRLHMKLGWLGLVLAVLATIFGYQVGVGTARITPPEFVLWGLNPIQFLAISIFSILTYAVLVGFAIGKRKNAEAHRTLMLLAALMVIPAAIDRIPWITQLYMDNFLGSWWGPYVASVVLAALFALVYSLLTGQFNRWLSFGALAYAITAFLIMRIAKTPFWESVANWLVGGP